MFQNCVSKTHKRARCHNVKPDQWAKQFLCYLTCGQFLFWLQFNKGHFWQPIFPQMTTETTSSVSLLFKTQHKFEILFWEWSWNAKNKVSFHTYPCYHSIYVPKQNWISCCQKTFSSIMSLIHLHKAFCRGSISWGNLSQKSS